MKYAFLILVPLFFLSSCADKRELYEDREIKCNIAYSDESNADSKTFEKTEACLREACIEWFTGGSFRGIETQIEEVRGPIEICHQ